MIWFFRRPWTALCHCMCVCWCCCDLIFLRLDFFSLTYAYSHHHHSNAKCPAAFCLSWTYARFALLLFAAVWHYQGISKDMKRKNQITITVILILNFHPHFCPHKWLCSAFAPFLFFLYSFHRSQMFLCDFYGFAYPFFFLSNSNWCQRCQ